MINLARNKCRKKQYKSIPIGEIFKESEKLYETEEKIKLQTQSSATSLAKLFIEQIDKMKYYGIKKRKAEGYSAERRGDRRAAESCHAIVTGFEPVGGLILTF